MTTPHSPQPRAPKNKKPTPKTANPSPDVGSANPTPADVNTDTTPKRTTNKKGKKEEYSAPIPRVRQVFALMLQNQKENKQKFPTNADIGKALQPDAPLGEDAVRSILDMMRDDLGMPVDYIPARKGHGFTEPVAGFPLDAISEEQAYYLIQCVQSLAPHRGSKVYADIRTAIKRACLGICFALNIDFEDIENALSFHLVGFDAPAPVDPELFKVAMRAILQKQEVTLEHRSVKRRGEVKQKTVEPLHLAVINHALYLYHFDADALQQAKQTAETAAAEAAQATDEAARQAAEEKAREALAEDGIRKFALTRIGRLQPTGRVCQPRKFDVQERIDRGLGAFDGKDAVEVELRFSPKVAPLIMERPWHKRQIVTGHDDGSITVKLRVTHSPEFEGAVLRWAGDVEVVTPGKLRDRMRLLGEAHARVHR